MNTKRYVQLTESERLMLSDLEKHSSDARERKRAHCILLSSSGKEIGYLSDLFSVKRDTISSWLNLWELEHLRLSAQEAGCVLKVNLQDKARSGRPEILSASAKKK